jgi:hypothetical protein
MANLSVHQTGIMERVQRERHPGENKQGGNHDNRPSAR